MNAFTHDFNDCAVEDVDPGVANLLRGMQRDRRWSLLPYGFWTEADGSFVIFDRGYRLICRKRLSGVVEILPFACTGNFGRKVDDLWVDWIDQRWLYTGVNHPARDGLSRLRLLGVVQRLGLEGEIIRRRKAAERERSLRRKYMRRRTA